MHTIQRILAAAALTALLAPAAAMAQQGQLGARIEARLNATTTAPRAALGGNGSAAANAKARATQELDRRTKALGDQLVRIGGIKHVSAEVKAALTAQTQSQISALADLKAKIDADDSTTTLRADVQSIGKSYRIFAVVMPQNAITAAVDRVNTVADLMTAMGAKLSVRIASSSAQGKDTSAASAALADYTAKIADAKVKASTALNLVVNLKADNGDATLIASNKAAVEQSRSSLKAAQAGLIAARKDISTIASSLGLRTSVQATSSAELR